MALLEVNGNLEGLGDGWFRFYENLEAEKFASDGTLLYVVSRDGAAMTCYDNLVSGHWEEDSTGTVRESSKPDFCERVLGRGIQPELSENHTNQIVFLLNDCLTRKNCRKYLESEGWFGQARELWFFLACVKLAQLKLSVSQW